MVFFFFFFFYMLVYGPSQGPLLLKAPLFLPANLAGNYNPGTSTALPGLMRGKPRNVPAIPGPVGAAVSNDWCITQYWSQDWTSFIIQ